MKKISTMLCVVVLALLSTTSVLKATTIIANFEESDDRAFAQVIGWNLDNGDIDTVANPVSDDVNSSATCLQFTRSTQYGSAIQFGNFSAPINLYKEPEFKMKIMSTDAVDKNVKVILNDIYGKSVSLSATSPSSTGVWQEIALDFTEFISSTPISLISSFVIQIDYAQAVPDPLQKFYVDDLSMGGYEYFIGDDDILTAYHEGLNLNYHANIKDVFETINAYGNGLFVGGMEHYNLQDSVECVTLWGEADINGMAPARAVKLSTADENVNFNEFNIKQSIVGRKDVLFSYVFRWNGEPADGFTSTPTFEYKVDEGTWVALATDSTVKDEKAWNAIGYTFPGDVSGDTLYIRIKNDADQAVCVVDFGIKTKLVFAKTITISGDTDVDTVDGDNTLQLTSAITPANANQATYWYISDGYVDSASVEPLTGLVTAFGAGKVKITAIAVDKKAVISARHAVTMANWSEAPDGIDNFELPEVSIYPNPVAKQLNISSAVVIDKVKVLTVTGQLLSEKVLNSANGTVNVSKLESGVYLLVVESGGKFKTQPFVKK